MTLNQLSKRFVHAWQIDASAIATLLVITAIVYFVGVQPMLDRRQAAGDAEIALDAARQRAAALSESARITRSQLAGARDELLHVEIPLQPGNAVNARVAAITGLASDCDLALDFVQPGQVTSTKRYGRQAMTLSGSGPYKVCCGFLSRFKDRFPDMSIKSFSLAVQQVDGIAAPRLSLSAEIVWYVLPPQK